MATTKKGKTRTTRKTSTTPWGWIAAAALAFALLATNLTGVKVNTVRGDLADMQAKLETPVPASETPVAATEAPATEEAMATDAPAQAQSCGQARDLGPWAPSSDGIGETFEVTATLDDSTGIVLGLWFPDGNTPWGTKEITTFVEPGLSIEVQAGAGRGFDYPIGCTASEVDFQMADHMVQRKMDTNYNGYVDVDELIRLGLVVVRFDRRAANPTQ